MELAPPEFTGFLMKGMSNERFEEGRQGGVGKAHPNGSFWKH